MKTIAEEQLGVIWELTGDDDHVPIPEGIAAQELYAVGDVYIDDVTGKILPPALVIAGRNEELEGF